MMTTLRRVAKQRCNMLALSKTTKTVKTTNRLNKITHTRCYSHYSTFPLHTEEDTELMGSTFAKTLLGILRNGHEDIFRGLEPGEKLPKDIILNLNGRNGSGKSIFSRGFMREAKKNAQNDVNIIHTDLDGVEADDVSPEKFRTLGIPCDADAKLEPGDVLSITLIEWPERLSRAFSIKQLNPAWGYSWAHPSWECGMELDFSDANEHKFVLAPEQHSRELEMEGCHSNSHIPSIRLQNQVVHDILKAWKEAGRQTEYMLDTWCGGKAEEFQLPIYEYCGVPLECETVGPRYMFTQGLRANRRVCYDGSPDGYFKFYI